MAYTYNEPVNGVFEPVSEVRFLIGDTTPSAPFSLTDAEIEYLIAQAGDNVRTAAANAAFSMGRKYSSYSSSTSKSVGNLSLSKDYGAQADRYYGLAQTLRDGTDLKQVVASVRYYEAPTQFYIGQFDNRGQYGQ